MNSPASRGPNTDSGYPADRKWFLGTPVLSGKRKTKPTAVKGKERVHLHGAFTGGWQAGYNNTVGSAEGWQPSLTFVSRKKRKTDGIFAEPSEHSGPSVEDYMDAEDLRDRYEPAKSQRLEACSAIPSGFVVSRQEITATNLLLGPGLRPEDISGELLRSVGWKIGLNREKPQIELSSFIRWSPTGNHKGVGFGIEEPQFGSVGSVRSVGIGSGSTKTGKSRIISAPSTSRKKPKKKLKLTPRIQHDYALDDPADLDGDSAAFPSESRPARLFRRSDRNIRETPGSEPPNRVVFTPKPPTLPLTTRDGKPAPPGFQLSDPALDLHLLSTCLAQLSVVPDDYTPGSILGLSGRVKTEPAEFPGTAETELFALTPEEAGKALKAASLPYGGKADAEKQARYLQFLRHWEAAPGAPVLPRQPQMSDAEWRSEMSEFRQVARMFRPPEGLLSAKFTGQDSGAGRKSSAAPQGRMTPQEAAARNMHGELTRVYRPFAPMPLVCKRFGVPPPATTRAICGSASGAADTISEIPPTIVQRASDETFAVLFNESENP